MLECRLLGSPELTIGGAPPPAELLWRKHLALLILLVRAPRRTRARDQLIGMLWAEKEEKAARHSLREAIRIVRKALGDDGLETVGDRVTLKAPATTDVDQLDARLGEEDWEGAAALVAGPFLDGLVVPDAPAFDDWVTSVRHGLLAKGLRALTACAEARLARGRATAAVDAAHRALALDPGSDNAMRAVLRAYAIQGDRAAALAAWQAFRDRLA